MSNQKIRGASSRVYQGIKFDSKLEMECFKLLQDENIPFLYNQVTIQLVPGFRLEKVHFYKYYKKNKEFIEYKTKKGEKLKLTSMTFTPDFYIEHRDNIIFIETKGFPNDVYPYKRKLFFYAIESNELYSEKKVYFFEPSSIKQVKDTIEILKNKIFMMPLKQIEQLLEEILNNSHIYQKDYNFCIKFIKEREFECLQEMILSIKIMEERKSKIDRIPNYDKLIELKTLIDDYVEQRSYKPETDGCFT